MINKEQLKKKFLKSVKTYDKNAIVQKQMAEILISEIPPKNFDNVLEIGSYTGILTSLAINNLDINNYLALDIIDSFDCIKNLNGKISFQVADIENFSSNKKFDLIISNASLQWVSDLNNVSKKLKDLLNQNGIVAFTTFGRRNLFEIRETFGIGLNYCSIEEIKSYFKDAVIFEEEKKLHFNSSIELLKHLKFTGVNSVSDRIFSYKEIKENLNLLKEKYKNTLTYEAIYVIYQHR